MAAIREHRVFRMFGGRTKIGPVEDAAIEASDRELAALTSSPSRRVDDLRFSAMSLIYGGGK